MNHKAHFQRFFAAAPGRMHFAAHSHHLWPDVTFEAQQRCWEDAALLADRKWEKIFGEVLPAAQTHIARLLNLSDPAGIAFGPNTHGFLMRLLSLFPADRRLRILATDSEFHSFTRQAARLEEEGLAQITRVATEPFTDFAARFAAEIRRGGHDLIYFSQVFYNSGYAIRDLAPLVDAVPNDQTIMVIDGYHGFCALPADLQKIQSRAFYMAGGYKYAMAGEGVCFLHVPPGYGARPRDTGWFAGFGALETAGGSVGYGGDGSRFLGATFDPVGLYRLNAVMGLLSKLRLDIAEIHRHAHRLQASFARELAATNSPLLNPGHLVVPIENRDRGNFLTFRSANAGDLHKRLLAADIVTDHRGDRLRFGFGIYHDAEDIDRLMDGLRRVLR
ncbi:MAG: aminotransferase class V-fold PLP-dependent enzyme [Dongiaceae bacterium]